MKIIETGIKDLKIIELKVHGDERGFFVERYSKQIFIDNGLPGDFAQDNHSRSGKNILRGLHYQNNPSQGKLVGVVRGKIWDVAVDIRSNSETYGQSFGIELSDTNGKLLWVPAGFAHGFCTLDEELTDVFYKVTTPYNPKGEGGIMWNDPDLNVKWPTNNPQISKRDENQQSFSEYKKNPINWD